MNKNEIRSYFPILKNDDIVFLNNGSGTLKPSIIYQELSNFHSKHLPSISRGGINSNSSSEDTWNKSVKNISGFFGAKSSEISFAQNTTGALNILINTISKNILKKGDVVYTTDVDHSSNILPWKEMSKIYGFEIKILKTDSFGKIKLDDVKKFDSHVKVFSFPHISNTFGSLNNVKEIVKILKQKGILSLLDTAQSAGHTKVNLSDLGVDFSAMTSNKFMGPSGLGILYIKESIKENMDPVLVGGGMNKKISKDLEITFSSTAKKFLAGSQNIDGVIATSCAIDFIKKIGIDNIEKCNKELIEYATMKLKEIDNIEIYNEGIGLTSIIFNIGKYHPQDVESYLSNKNIFIREGYSCAKLIEYKMEDISGFLRITPYAYNTKEEIDKLINALKNGGDFVDDIF